MELQRGICSLCTENTRVLKPSDAEEYCKFLPEILYENFLPEAEFQKIKKLIKLCLICCFKIQNASQTKNLFNNNKENEDDQFVGDCCHFCKIDQNLVIADNKWRNLVDKTEGFLKIYDFPIHICMNCVFYFDTIFNIRTKLLYRFPQLAVQKKKSSETSQKQNDTPKRKSLSKSPPSSKKRKIFDDCFTYLQPLCNNNNYDVDEELRQDKKLYRKIAYVNLRSSINVNVKETPKMRPIIKIKLKPKKDSSQVYINVSKSEEPPSRPHKQKNRRHSFIEKRETSEESDIKLDETPKAAATSTLVPKRRVSTYIDNGEAENEEEKVTVEEKEEEVKDCNSDGIEKLIEKYSEKDAEENGKNTPELEENELEKVESSVEENSDLTNSEKDTPLQEINPVENTTKDSSESSSTVNSPSGSDEKPPKNESSIGESDSEASDQFKLNVDSESFNGSERKKKRVTFSDEIV